MGFNFSFFGKQEVRKFNYRPRFYDPEAEERRKKYGDFTKKNEGYVPGLLSSLRNLFVGFFVLRQFYVCAVTKNRSVC